MTFQGSTSFILELICSLCSANNKLVYVSTLNLPVKTVLRQVPTYLTYQHLAVHKIKAVVCLLWHCLQVLLSF